MKKMLLFFVLLSGTLFTMAQEKTRYITASGLNLRSDENEKAKVLKVLKKGDAVELLGYQGNLTVVNGNKGHWVQVSYKGLHGYLFDYHLSELMPPDVLFKEVPKKIEYRTVSAKSGLRMRKEASMDAKVLLTIPNGAKVQYIQSTGIAAEGGDEEGEFVKVKYNNKIGYVHGNYLD
jgi:uncharacterized protein YgiM (DUF1202 family)